jgi:hypothetical protein
LHIGEIFFNLLFLNFLIIQKIVYVYRRCIVIFFIVFCIVFHLWSLTDPAVQLLLWVCVNATVSIRQVRLVTRLRCSEPPISPEFPPSWPSIGRHVRPVGTDVEMASAKAATSLRRDRRGGARLD